MAEKQASYIQASSHPADTDRLVLEGLMNPAGAPVSGAAYGVGQGSGELLVTQNGTPNMSVNVAAGHVWIDGTESATQGAYHGYNDATKNLVIAASDPTNPRKDLVIAKVQDAAYSGAVNAWTLAVVTGTPAASPAEPAVPANAVVLAMVNVAALASTITNANITDRRRRACGLGGITVCTAATRPAAPYIGQTIYETDTQRVLAWNGTNWTAYRLGNEPDQFFSGTVNNGVATTLTDFITQNAILSLPYPYTMVVSIFANVGANAGANRSFLGIRDEAGANICYKSSNLEAATEFGITNVADNRGTMVGLGKKDYAAAATCGFRLAYRVTTSNIYVDASVRVSFIPR